MADERINYRECWHTQMAEQEKQLRDKREQRLLEMFRETVVPPEPGKAISVQEWNQRVLGVVAPSLTKEQIRELATVPQAIVLAPGPGKSLVVNEDGSVTMAQVGPGPTQAIPETKQREDVNSWTKKMNTQDSDIQAVYAAQQYVKDFNQWLADHPGETPTREMVDRYKHEVEFVARNYRL